MMALSGVRSSWLMLETNCDLCSLAIARSEEHTSEHQSLRHLVCRLLLEKKKKKKKKTKKEKKKKKKKNKKNNIQHKKILKKSTKNTKDEKKTKITNEHTRQ